MDWKLTVLIIMRDVSHSIAGLARSRHGGRSAIQAKVLEPRFKVMRGRKISPAALALDLFGGKLSRTRASTLTNSMQPPREASRVGQQEVHKVRNEGNGDIARCKLGAPKKNQVQEVTGTSLDFDPPSVPSTPNQGYSRGRSPVAVLRMSAISFSLSPGFNAAK